MKNLLILGGAGYIGSHTVKKLSIKGYNVIIADNLSTGYERAVMSPNFFKVDIRDRASLNKIFQKFPIDVVVNLVGLFDAAQSVAQPQKYYSNNLMSVMSVLDCMLENNVKKFVYASSSDIYGKTQNFPVDEKHRLAPITPFGWISFMVDKLLYEYDVAYGVKSIGLRFDRVAGADRSKKLYDKNSKNLIPGALMSTLGKKDFVSIAFDNDGSGDGTCVHDYVHVEDLADAIILSVEKILKSDKSYKFNIGTGRGFSDNEIIQLVQRITNFEVPVLYTPAPTGRIEKMQLSNSLAQEILYWIPKYVSPEEMIISEYNVLLTPPY